MIWNIKEIFSTFISFAMFTEPNRKFYPLLS